MDKLKPYDLISRKEAEQRITLEIQELMSQCKTERQDNAVTMLWKRMIDALRDVPAIDPDSLRERGRWERDPDSPPRHTCSRCGSIPYDNEADQLRFNADFKEYLTQYCPDFGARMDLEGYR